MEDVAASIASSSNSCTEIYGVAFDSTNPLELKKLRQKICELYCLPSEPHTSDTTSNSSNRNSNSRSYEDENKAASHIVASARTVTTKAYRSLLRSILTDCLTDRMRFDAFAVAGLTSALTSARIYHEATESGNANVLKTLLNTAVSVAKVHLDGFESAQQTERPSDFKIGDRVWARFPLTGQSHHATIGSVANPDDGSYTVEWDSEELQVHAAMHKSKYKKSLKFTTSYTTGKNPIHFPRFPHFCIIDMCVTNSYSFPPFSSFLYNQYVCY